MAELADIIAHTLGELAEKFALKLQGDAQLRITGVSSLAPGKPGHLSFCTDPRRRAELAETQAAAVVISPREAEKFPGNALLAPDPALAFARIAGLFDGSRQFTPGLHPAAVVAPGATVGPGCWIAPHAVIEDGASMARAASSDRTA
ncbi:MAG: LpxD N-terminal domain-containing protein [Nevskiales bacterium]